MFAASAVVGRRAASACARRGVHTTRIARGGADEPVRATTRARERGDRGRRGGPRGSRRRARAPARATRGNARDARDRGDASSATTDEDGGARDARGRAQAYIHAKHMYDVGATKNRKLVFGVATAAIVLIGGYIPVFAIQFQVRARARRATRARGRDARIP